MEGIINSIQCKGPFEKLLIKIYIIIITMQSRRFYSSMMDKFSGTKIGEGITAGASKFKNIAFTPMMALSNIEIH